MENHKLDVDREQEAHGYANARPNFDLVTTKESILPTVENSIGTLIKGCYDGEINALDVFATFKKLEKIFNDAKTTVEHMAQLEANKYENSFTFSGVEFSSRKGYAQLDYEKDDVYRTLKTKLANRKTLLDNVYKSGDLVYDTDGVQVPNVGVKSYTKDSLTVKFK